MTPDKSYNINIIARLSLGIFQEKPTTPEEMKNRLREVLLSIGKSTLVEKAIENNLNLCKMRDHFDTHCEFMNFIKCKFMLLPVWSRVMNFKKSLLR